MLIYMGLIIALFGYMTWSQMKRNKQIQAIRSSVAVGDKVTTIGGLVGRVTGLTEDEMTLETGDHSVTMKRWAIQLVDKNIVPLEAE
ncbi:MAG: preprotein translocase subunit YajC [Bacillota bacterium]|nr:preprotein translocase subunit YajC [Bacillota bacterium]